jgi:hypothetical protein
MDKPTDEEILTTGIGHFSDSIGILLKERRTLPALILLYAAIDSLGSLLRPETKPDTDGTYFKKWADDYVINPSRPKFKSEDLWAARCGLLHQYTPSSKLSREGRAQQLHYFRTNGNTIPPAMQYAFKEIEKQGKILVDVDVLFEAFTKGVHRFSSAIDGDAFLKKRVLHHAKQFLGHWSHTA